MGASLDFYNALFQCIEKECKRTGAKIDFSSRLMIGAYSTTYGIVLEFPNGDKFLKLTNDELPARKSSREIIAQALHDCLVTDFVTDEYERWRGYVRLLIGREVPPFKRFNKLEKFADDEILNVRMQQACTVLEDFAVFEKLPPELELKLEEENDIFFGMAGKDKTD